MNIAILIPTLSYGGAERVAAEISKYFFQQKHNIYIFTEQQSPEKYDFAGKIVKLKCSGGNYSNFNSWHGTIYGLLKRASEVRWLKIYYKIDVSISFMELYNMINVLSKATDRVIVRICTVLSAYDHKEKIYDTRIIKLLYNRADCVITISHYGKREMEKIYGVHTNIIKVIPNSVETYEEQEIDAEWPYGENAIICLARVSSEKQQKLLFEIFKQVKKSIPDARLLLVGNDEGEYAADLKKKVRKSDLAKDVIFTGYIKNTKYYLGHCKLYILLSKVEGFGNTTIEALSMGVPTICMDSPGASREILAPHTQRNDLENVEYAEYGGLAPFIDENNNGVINENKKKIISNAIIDIISDKKIQKNYSVKGKKRAAMFRISRVGKMWNQILGE